MYFKYDNYRHGDGEVRLVVSKQPLRAPNGMVRGQKITFTIDGRIMGSSQSSITTQLAALEAAYQVQGGRAGLYADDGSPTVHLLDANNTLGGIEVVEAVSYPEGKGAEYATGRAYRIVLSAEVPNLAVAYLAFTESLSFSGGGPKIKFLELLTGEAQKQTLVEQTTYKCVQSGSAVGYGAYPPFPPPLFPGDQIVGPETAGDSPTRSGPPGSPIYVEFPIRWKYVFESVNPLGGIPTVPPQ